MGESRVDPNRLFGKGNFSALVESKYVNVELGNRESKLHNAV